MKIAFLSFYNGIVYRGVETYVHELANKLVDRGHDVTVFQSGEVLPGTKYNPVVIPTKYNSIKSGGDFIIFINQILESIAIAKFTLRSLKKFDNLTEVVVSTNNRLQAFISRVWTFFNKIKLVIPGQGGPGIDERFALWCFPNAFVPLSEYQLKWSNRVNPFVKKKKIPNGVDLNKFHTSKTIDIKLERPIILCAAAFWPYMKRQQLLIKAVAKLEKGSLLLAGAGEGYQYLEKLGRKTLGNRFLIKSFKHEEMPQIYSSCDIFSFPTSPWESFGIVLVEAMASGLPVVATDDPIRREIVGDAGLYVDPENTEEYAKILEKALNTDWGGKPRKQAEKFSWDKIALEYEKLFKDLLSK